MLGRPFVWSLAWGLLALPVCAQPHSAAAQNHEADRVPIDGYWGPPTPGPPVTPPLREPLVPFKPCTGLNATEGYLSSFSVGIRNWLSWGQSQRSYSIG